MLTLTYQQTIANLTFLQRVLEHHREYPEGGLQAPTQDLQTFEHALWYGVREQGNEELYEWYKLATEAQRYNINILDGTVLPEPPQQPQHVGAVLMPQQNLTHADIAAELFRQGYRAELGANMRIRFSGGCDCGVAPNLQECDSDSDVG